MGQVTIQLQIADRPYRLTVSSEQEPFFHEATRLINKQLKTYSDSYAFKDRQDLLAMVALQYTYEALKNNTEVDEEQEKEVVQRLLEIESSLNEIEL
ncbi:MAG: cell division protein ZapA [Bacteroidales bacterium]|nr:cell division protein ZapA [Bacteroidales bacterium]